MRRSYCAPVVGLNVHLVQRNVGWDTNESLAVLQQNGLVVHVYSPKGVAFACRARFVHYLHANLGLQWVQQAPLWLPRPQDLAISGAARGGAVGIRASMLASGCGAPALNSNAGLVRGCPRGWHAHVFCVATNLFVGCRQESKQVLL